MQLLFIDVIFAFFADTTWRITAMATSSVSNHEILESRLILFLLITTVQCTFVFSVVMDFLFLLLVVLRRKKSINFKILWQRGQRNFSMSSISNAPCGQRWMNVIGKVHHVLSWIMIMSSLRTRRYNKQSNSHGQRGCHAKQRVKRVILYDSMQMLSK